MGENIAAGAILILLVVIGIVIGWKGTQFDPNLYSVRDGSLEATAAPVWENLKPFGLRQVAAVPDQAITPEKPTASETPSESSAENTSSTPPPAATGEPLEIGLDGIKPMGATEFYTSDTLYEKIDGRAPAYQNFNVQQMRCRTFSVVAASGSYVDVSEYRFDSPLDAFGMFAIERDPKGKPTDFVTDGYSGEMGYFFRQGPVYVQIIASDEKPETIAVATAIAQNRAKALPVDDTRTRRPPRTARRRNDRRQRRLCAGKRQGQSTFKNVFQAKYNFDGAELPFFIMVVHDGRRRQGMDVVPRILRPFGKAEALPDVNGGENFPGADFWQVEGDLSARQGNRWRV